MLSREQAQKLVEKILSYSKFADCTVSVVESEQAHTRFANNSVTTAGFGKEREITISSTRETKTGTAQTTDMDESALRAAVARSEELAGLAPPNPEYTEPPGPQNYPQSRAYDPDTAAARSPQMLPHIRAVIELAKAKKLISAGFIQRTATATAIANKKKLVGFHAGTDSSMSTTVRSADGSSSGWASQPSIRIRELDGKLLAQRAVSKCEQWKNPVRIEPGKYTVVLEPTAVSDLVTRMAFSFDARGAEEGRTFLSKKGGGMLLGEKLFPDHITLRSDPLGGILPGSPWSAEMVPNRPMPWIEKGLVRNIAYSRYWAEKTGKQPTPIPGSLVLEGGDKTLEELIKATERGLLVTRFWYIRPVNPQTLQFTGLTRDGLFLIENGKVSKPVVNLRFNDSPIHLLENIKLMSKSVRARGAEGAGMLAPAVQATDFLFTSVSDAV